MIYLPPGNCRNKHFCFQNKHLMIYQNLPKKGQVDHKIPNFRVEPYDLPGLLGGPFFEGFLLVLLFGCCLFFDTETKENNVPQNPSYLILFSLSFSLFLLLLFSSFFLSLSFLVFFLALLKARKKARKQTKRQKRRTRRKGKPKKAVGKEKRNKLRDRSKTKREENKENTTN